VGLLDGGAHGQLIVIRDEHDGELAAFPHPFLQLETAQSWKLEIEDGEIRRPGQTRSSP
jgi:hypothetical protein